MLKKVIIFLAIIIALLIGGFQFMKFNTKKASPEVFAQYELDNAKIDIFYCSPKKRGRKVFEEVVGFGEVWRTGANEASTFTTNQDLYIEGELLPTGSYSLWTVPGEMEWSLILNSEIPDWGVGFSGLPALDKSKTVLEVNAPAIKTENTSESLVIQIIDNQLEVKWDDMAARFNVESK